MFPVTKRSRMPITARAEAVSTKKPRSMLYVAEYSNYHKFGASSRVLPGVSPE
jgi:hypothetical protein